MPFHDQEDLQTKTARQSTAVERFVRRIFIEDWNLKLLALAITFVLWFAVTGQKPISKRFTDVQLSFVLADGMEISNDPPRTVDVTLSGGSDRLEEINPMTLLATVVVGENTTGDRVVRLSRERVTMDNLPSGVQIDGFQPAVVSLRLEPRIEREINVEIKFEGRVPEGYEVFAASTNPARVKVHGPAGRVNGIEKAPTESILLDGKKSSFDLNQVAINIPDQKVDVDPGVVKVHVEIRERAIQKVSSLNGHQPASNSFFTR